MGFILPEEITFIIIRMQYIKFILVCFLSKNNMCRAKYFQYKLIIIPYYREL